MSPGEKRWQSDALEAFIFNGFDICKQILKNIKNLLKKC